MARMERVYLDNAATSFPKPDCVHEAMLAYMTGVGASPGRGAYAESLEGARLIRVCRERVARLFNAPSPDHVVFTLNTSDALNLGIKGMVTHARGGAMSARRADVPKTDLPSSDRPIHIVATAMDHNSILRPLNALAADGLAPRVEWTCVPADAETGLIDPMAFRAALRPGTLLACIGHASNVTGTLQPLADLAEVCSRAGVPLLVDAAQTAGRVPIDMSAMGLDLLAFPGHKALLGPLGTGGLVIRPGLEERLAPLREGGTGSVSELDTQPLTLPDKYEPGSHNTPGLVGLSEGLRWLGERGVAALWADEVRLIDRVTTALADRERFPGLRLLGPGGTTDRVGVFTLVHEAADPHEMAAILESGFGVLSRAGVHCAPRAHGTFGTRATGGLRLSVGAFTTAAHVDRALDGLAAICESVGSVG